MQYFYKNNHSQNLILFFSGWGCDEHQFTNLHDTNDDILILFDYQDLNLDFDFTPYKKIDLIAYSAGVFVASIFQKSLPPLHKKIAINGNPYLFDKKFGLSTQTINIFNSITLDNYLEFRRQYMVISDAEYKRYNELQSLRTLESCQQELTSLQNLYTNHRKEITQNFDLALMADKDPFFSLDAQKEFYGDKLRIIPNAKHHIFFRFNSFHEILEIK